MGRLSSADGVDRGPSLSVNHSTHHLDAIPGADWRPDLVVGVNVSRHVFRGCNQDVGYTGGFDREPTRDSGQSVQ